MCVCFAYMYACPPQCPWRPGEGFGSPETGVTDSGEPPCGRWRSNLGSLKSSQCSYHISSSGYIFIEDRLHASSFSTAGLEKRVRECSWDDALLKWGRQLSSVVAGVGELVRAVERRPRSLLCNCLGSRAGRDTMVHARVLILNQFDLTHSSQVAEDPFLSYHHMLWLSFDSFSPWCGLPRAELLPEQIRKILS